MLLSVSTELALASETDTLRYGMFGKVILYKPATVANSLVLFVSGDGGWNLGVVDMAKNLVGQGAIVAGIDIRQYYKRLRTTSSRCYYPAGDFEELSMMLQKKYKLAQYHKPVLIGYSSGATLVYGTLAQAPANTFKGAISLGFCPDIEINKPLCSGSGLKQHPLREGKSYYLEAAGKLSAPFIVLHGAIDQVCPLDAIGKYMQEVNTGLLYELPKVGHGFAVTSRWLPQFMEAYRKVMEAPSFAEQKTAQNKLLQSQKLLPLPGDFPVIPIPSAAKDTMPMVFLISGDGGWTSFDNSLGEALSEKGMPVIGLDAQKYFWNKKKPEETASEITRATRHFMQQWDRKTFILAGYSFGASIVPFLADLFPANLKASLAGIYCLSPDETADFEIHISDMLGLGSTDDPFNVLNEIKKIKYLHPVCVFGVEEDTKLRDDFREAGAKILTLPGNHHYNDNPAAAADVILKEVDKGHNK